MVATFFFFNDTATTGIYTLSLHDALQISGRGRAPRPRPAGDPRGPFPGGHGRGHRARRGAARLPVRKRSEEHTSELQSRQYIVCRFLLEKKKALTLAMRLEEHTTELQQVQ